MPAWTKDPDGYDLSVRQAATGLSDLRKPFGLHDLVLEVQPVPGPDDGLAGVVRDGVIHYHGRRYRVTDGRFVALAASPVRGRRLRYRVSAEAGTGERVDVAGVKWVTGRPWRWWADTSRMYVVVCGAGGEPVTAAGVVRLSPWAFVRQLTTFRGRPGDVAAFVWRFVVRLVLAGRRSGRRPGPRTAHDQHVLDE